MSQQNTAQATTPSINFKGLMMPYKPPVDKIAAATFLQIYSKNQLESLEFWYLNDCPQEQFDLWEQSGIYPIDIGDRKYHKAGVGSATEFLVNDLGIKLTSGESRVLAMVNENNKTGSLKRPRFSVPSLLREMYEITDDLYHIDIVNAVGEVLVAFMSVEDNQGLVRRKGTVAEALPHLAAQFAPSNNAPLTLGRYVSDLWKLGKSPEEIREKISFWDDGYYDLIRAQQDGKKALAAMTHRDEFSVGNAKAIVLETDDRFLVGAVIKSGEYGIRVIVSSDGHVTISTRRLDLAALAKTLEQKEPGCWYYQAAVGALLNGGPQYIGTAPTTLSIQELKELLQTYVQVR